MRPSHTHHALVYPSRSHRPTEVSVGQKRMRDACTWEASRTLRPQASVWSSESHHKRRLQIVNTRPSPVSTIETPA